ncbi:MotA/TolQ/ExbB proton channel family protein [Candidatus Nitrotoga fabula]|uniref:MotA/TolQ/ExbB proton channel family protein n=1 Tax=Candidatus Nitrotoga fabula TaxID=2182327 RepID=A0A916F9E4_9PROT|nr:MotA/TolQ/ExbB proton channel family protein [Candidatus Nitrotoga fabula]CAE6727914.1 MotA/TolQ/ExbB proton channel family protein [Candidatus Nitrotoga fabula]
MSGLFSVDSAVVSGTLVLLLTLSVVTWTIALLKLWRQLRSDKSNRVFSEVFWAARDWQAAAEVAQQGSSDLARMAQAGFTEVKNLNSEQHDLKHVGAPQDVLERMLRQQVENMQRYNERGLAELATIGSTSPFVGLFGTVWGIMHALEEIGETGTASLDVVAGPIGEALIATAIGIATALPAVLAYNYFLRRLRVQVTEFENFAHDFVRLALKHNFKL